MGKVFIGVFYEIVVVTIATKREDAVKVLRKALGARHRREAAPISLVNHVALVCWSKSRNAYWYRLPSSNGPCSIHADRITPEQRALVPAKDPDRVGWDTNTSASRPPNG